jgi:hypothetical protein
MLHNVPGAAIIGQDLTQPEQILADFGHAVRRHRLVLGLDGIGRSATERARRHLTALPEHRCPRRPPWPGTSAVSVHTEHRQARLHVLDRAMAAALQAPDKPLHPFFR